MPKISAPTVAEHRATQRAALLRAGEEILLESGLAGFSPRSVTERAGLSRSSFYDYFPSKDDLLVAIAISAIERWDAEIEEALSAVEPGLEELRTFVTATMTMTAEGKHAIAGVLREAELSPSRFDELMTLHDALLRPVRKVLTDLGAEPTRSTVMLVQGVLGAGVDLVSHGAEPHDVAGEAFELLTRGFFR